MMISSTCHTMFPKGIRRCPCTTVPPQFAPFAALTGHNAAITEAARLTEAEQELSESDAEVLNRKLAYLQSLDEKADY